MADTLWDEATGKIIGELVALVIGTGLVGGCGFFLFKAQRELLKFRQVNLDIKQRLDRDRRDMEVVAAWRAPEHQFAPRIIAVYQQLRSHKFLPQYDSNLARQAESQLREVIVRLVSLRGQVSGHQFADPSRIPVRESFIASLEPQLEIARALEDAVPRWNELSVAEREIRLDAILQLTIKQLERESALNAATQSAMLAHQHKSEDDEIAASEKMLELSEFNKKAILFAAGIAIGVILVALGLQQFLAQ
jgi:hypothetical protein